MFNHTCFYLKWIGLYGILVTMGKKVSIGRAALILGVSVSTLRRWDEEGRLVAERTEGGQRRYDMDQLTHQTARQADDTRTTIAYARVSSADQKNDLERQRNVLELYCAKNGWQYELVSDIGSGMNYRKKGLTRLLDAILDDRVGRLVITHKDRLLRFGAELMFAVCEAKHVEVVIINQGDEQRPFEEELASDVLEIITVFSARMYGARSHKSHKLIEEMTKAVDDAQSA